MPGVGELSALLVALADAGVEFVLVGGAAAVIHGAPITTQDVDIVHERGPENVKRLMTALEDLDARVVDLGGQDLRPTAAALEGKGQSLLRTRLGRLDVLGELHGGADFAQLAPTAERVSLGDREILVIDLLTLIQVKAAAGRAKDRLMMPILLALAKQRGTEVD